MADTLTLPSDALILRQLSRSSLLDFAREVVPDYETPRHIRILAEHLEAVERGEVTRLMVFMPPRHGKSRLISQIFPCWFLGRQPTKEVVQAGYAADISIAHSRKARDLFVSEGMRRVFPRVRHSPERAAQGVVAVERQSAHEWGTVLGGQYRASGVGGPLTGKGADLAVIDDPIKNRQEANSTVRRNEVWDWYTSTLYTRLSPAGAIVLVMTRWHEDDLAGRLLQQMDHGVGDRWEVIRMPAINDQGAALWPERWDLPRLEQTRQAVGSADWEALYQQEPTIPGGNLFASDRVEIVPANQFPSIRYVRFWDLASSEKQVNKSDPDFTAGCLLGVEQGNIVPRVWIKDLVFGQWAATERNARIYATAERDGPGVGILIEQSASYKDTVKIMQEALHGLRSVSGVVVSSDKVTRAMPLVPVFEAGNVRMAEGDWNAAMRKQCQEFPNGKHDDLVDSMTGAFNYLYRPGGGLQMPALAGALRVTSQMGGW